MNNLSIRTRLLIGILLPTLIVYSIFVAVDTRQGRTEAVRHAEQYLRELTLRFAAQADGQFYAASQIPVGTADVLSLERLPGEKELYELLKRNLDSHPEIIGSGVAFEPHRFRDDLEYFAPLLFRTPDGSEPLCLHLDAEYAKIGEKPYPQWDWYSRCRDEQAGSWSEPFLGKASKTLICTYSTPVFQDGKFVGVALIDISLEQMRRLFTELSSDGTTFRLISRKGTFISAPFRDEQFVMKETVFSLAEKYDHPQLAEIGREMIAGKSDVVRYDGLIDDEKVWLGYAPLTSTGWSLMASIPESRVMAPVYKKLYWSLTVFTFVFCMIAGIIIAATWRMTTPIRRLAEFAGELAEGNLDAKVGSVHHSGSEIGRLVAAFDRMTVDLKSNIEQRIREESARKAVESELRVARRIQASLLPRIFPPFPDRNEFELHAMNEPASFIAGDFFDFFFLDRNTLGIVMADVSGHGIPAAMFMAVSRTAIRNNAISGRSPVEIIRRVNTILSTDNDDSMFVTVFYAHYDVLDGTLHYVNAGHNPPYVLRNDGTRETLRPTGPFLAAFEDAEFEENRTKLQPGETLFTFTDGVTEAHTVADDLLFGESRLEVLLDAVRDRTVEDICNRVYRTVDEYSRGERHDDVTLLVLKRNI